MPDLGVDLNRFPKLRGSSPARRGQPAACSYTHRGRNRAARGARDIISRRSTALGRWASQPSLAGLIVGSAVPRQSDGPERRMWAMRQIATPRATAVHEREPDDRSPALGDPLPHEPVGDVVEEPDEDRA